VRATVEINRDIVLCFEPYFVEERDAFVDEGKLVEVKYPPTGVMGEVKGGDHVRRVNHHGAIAIWLSRTRSVGTFVRKYLPNRELVS
jgi:hypothetical protein